MVLDSINVSTFSRLIRTLLLAHDRVSLPEMGSFVIENQPSEIVDEGRLIEAPTRTVAFSVKETWNDELLERAYAVELERAMLELEDGEELTTEQLEEKNRHTLKLFLDQAKREIRQFTAEVYGQLQQSGVFQFPGLGTMRMSGKKQEITFEKAADCDLSPEGFGLVPLSIKPLATPSRLTEQVVPKPQPQPKREREEREVRSVREEREKREKREKKEKRDKIVTKKKKPSIFKWIYICLGFILLVIILFVVAFIFREELRPWLIRILYSSSDIPYV